MTATDASLRRWLAFGTGLGIAIGPKDLEAAIVRSRPSGPSLLRTITIADFRNRPAAEWGAELQRFLSAAGEKRLPATVLLPREEVIVRAVALPGVAAKDIASALELQIETLHPYGDEDVVWSWQHASKDSVLVGLVRRAVLDSYETLFSEAGIGLSAATFSSAALHASLRIWHEAPASILCFSTDDRGRTEVYGESPARPVYSAAFTLPAERALALSRAELRLNGDAPAPLRYLQALPAGRGMAQDPSPVAYAGALAASAPFAARFANLIPPERRASQARRQYIVPIVLASALVIVALIAFVIYPAVEERRYRESLGAEIHRLEPVAMRAQALEHRAETDRVRIAQLDDFRRRPQADLDLLNELTRILPSQVWTSSIEVFPDSVVISGEADQAAPLLKLLDSSPFLQNSEFALAVTRTASQGEQFRIRSLRRNRAGRTTP